MDILPQVNEHSNSNGENAVKTESNQTIMAFSEDGLHYSDFENAEYEEVNGEIINAKQDDEYINTNPLRNCRKRTRNFTQRECQMLYGLLEEYSDILEVKRNDHKTNTLKNKAWDEITMKFNNNTHEEYRTPMQLRTFYENLKKKRKRLYRERETTREDCIENGEGTEISSNSLDNQSYSDGYIQIKGPDKFPDNFKKHSSFIENYQMKKIELIDREIEKVKSACEQQRRLFLLQEEKLLLEIEEIKGRLKKK